MDELIAKLDRLIHTSNDLYSHYHEIDALISSVETYSRTVSERSITSCLITEQLIVHLHTIIWQHFTMDMDQYGFAINIIYDDTLLIYISINNDEAMEKGRELYRFYPISADNRDEIMQMINKGSIGYATVSGSSVDGIEYQKVFNQAKSARK